MLAGRVIAPPGPPAATARGRGRLLVAVVVLACAVGATVVGAWPDRTASHAPSTLMGHAVTASRAVTYEPHSTRRWGTETGLHEVRVVAGMLSVLGDDGRATHYLAGGSFVAGWEDYVASNSTGERVETEIRYIRPLG